MISDKSDFIYTPADFLGWALASGWSPSVLPVGVIYTFQAPVTRRIAEQGERFVENRELTVSNARMFMTVDDGPPILIAALNPGAASLASQLEHLAFLGDVTRFAAIVGSAGSLTRDFAIADTVVVSSALRTDHISDRYLPPAPTVDADPEFVASLQRELGEGTPDARAWTVPVPYRSTREHLAAALEAGAQVVEMEIATLFAVAQSLDLRAAATVVISDVNRVEGWKVDWRDTLEPTLRAIDATIQVMRALKDAA